MKWRKFSSTIAWGMTLVCLWVNGCGSKTAANVINVSVGLSANPVILGQSLTATASVTGATNTDVTWKCQFTTTTTSGTTTTPSKPADCPTDNSLGKLTNAQATTVTYTAPTTLPDQTKFPLLQLLIVATSAQDTTKTGSATFFIDSGISVVLTPLTATVPTNEQQQFHVSLTNDLQAQGVTWLVTQGTATTTTPPPQLATCTVSGNASGCGSIDANGLYTAPTAVPTTATLTIVVTAKADTTRFQTGTITIIAGGPITFNGISPTIAPQGATFWDIFLDAPNISSASIVTLTDSNNGAKLLNSSSGQLKVLFPIPTSTTTNPTSTGMRVRLFPVDLAKAGAFTVSVSDPGQPVTQSSTGTFSYSVIPVRPTVTASIPDDFPQGTLTNEARVTIDGGYFGPNGQLAQVLFQGNTIPQDPQIPSSSRQLNTAFPSGGINSGGPGLYPLSVAGTGTPPSPPLPNNPAVTNLAVFPDYATNPPVLKGAPVAAGTKPSAIDIDPTLGVAVVAETGANAVQFYTIGAGTLTPLNGPVPVGNVPTGVSVNRNNHTAAVVNYQDQSVTVLPIPGVPAALGTPFTVSLASLLGVVTPAPLPYAIGVDPDTNLALVAYSSTSSSSLANVGFIVNLNTSGTAFPCLASSGVTQPPCVYAQVTLNTGAYPQIAMAPRGHLAFVTPGGGGAGVVRGVDVTKASTSTGISTITLTAKTATVTTSAAHGLVPGNAGTVLIEGVKSSGSTNFNGAFPVSVISSTQFAYTLNSTASDTGTGGTVFYSTPNLTFAGLSQTTQGIAINPITRTAALADANGTGSNGPQINLLNSLDQSVSSISFFATCTAYTTSCSNSPELLSTADVAWQPYSNALVSFNPQQNQVSVSDPAGRKRYAIVATSGQGASTITVTNGTTTNSLTLWGGLAVDPVTNQAFAVQSGSGTIDIIDLGPGSNNTLKAAQITELIVPSPTPGPGTIGGIPNALVPQATLTSAAPLSGVQIFGSGFVAGAQVRLDGTPIPSANVQVISARQITATIPASFLAAPHRYALDVISNSVQSNVTDFLVIQSVDLTAVCSSGPPRPSSVAIADQIANGPFSPIAVVTNSGCNSISVIDISPGSATFGAVKNTIAVGANPQGIAMSQHFGLAVVANNGDGTASVVNLLTNSLPVPSVATGTNPTGVAIDDTTAAAIVVNTGSNTVSEINLALLFGSSPATSLTASSIGGVQQPIAVAIDPDRGTNNQGIAVVTGLQLVSGQPPNGAVTVIDIGSATPAVSATNSVGIVSATPTGIVFDPSLSPALFYVNSSGSNQITAFNPDSGSISFVTVGINPASLALNPQTGAILTANVAGKTISIVDTLSNPMKTRQTLGIPGSPQFGVAIDQFTNLAVIVDQANNRVLLFPMPN